MNREKFKRTTRLGRRRASTLLYRVAQSSTLARSTLGPTSPFLPPSRAGPSPLGQLSTKNITFDGGVSSTVNPVSTRYPLRNDPSIRLPPLLARYNDRLYVSISLACLVPFASFLLPRKGERDRDGIPARGLVHGNDGFRVNFI